MALRKHATICIFATLGRSYQLFPLSPWFLLRKRWAWDQFIFTCSAISEIYKDPGMSQILCLLASSNIYSMHGQTCDGVDQVYNQRLGEVLDFFSSKLQRYYSSSRLTLLLTLLDIPPRILNPIGYLSAVFIPLPPRLKVMDSDAHGLLGLFPSCYFPEKWGIFRDFLDSCHPLALDRRRHATAASACLKIIFIYDQAPHSWHTPTINQRPQRHRADLKPKTLWHRNVRHRARRKHLYNYEQGVPPTFLELALKTKDQRLRSGILTFLLEKSAYSVHLLKFACRRVFRFGYLQQNHPIYMKKVIFALAKYIHRVTGETAQVRTCESIWGRQRWFTEN